MQISINTQVQVDSRLKTSHVGFDRRFIAFGRQPKFSTLHVVCSIELSCFFFSLPLRPFFLFFFFEADKTNIFQAKSVAVGENLQPSFNKTNHAHCQPFHLDHCHWLITIRLFSPISKHSILATSDDDNFFLSTFDFSFRQLFNLFNQ